MTQNFRSDYYADDDNTDKFGYRHATTATRKLNKESARGLAVNAVYAALRGQGDSISETQGKLISLGVTLDEVQDAARVHGDLPRLQP